MAPRGLTISLNSLLHSVTCNRPKCHGTCAKWKFAIVHAQICPNRSKNTCCVCRSLKALCAIHAKTCNSDGCKVPFCKVIRGGSTTSRNVSHPTQTKPSPHPPNNMSKSTKAKLQLKKDVSNKIFLPVLKAPPTNETELKKCPSLGSRRMGHIEKSSKKPRVSSIFDECRNYEKESNIVRCDWTAEDSKDSRDSLSCTPTDSDIDDKADEDNDPHPEQNPVSTESDLNQSSKDTVPKPVTSTSFMPLEAQEEPASISSPIEYQKEKVISDDDDDDEGQTRKLKFGDEGPGIKVTMPRNFKMDAIALCASGVLLAPLFSYMVVKILKAAART